jgi:hypothetical protein
MGRYMELMRMCWREEECMDLVGICGDNCHYCPRYLATQNGSTKELETVKELWVKLGLRDPAFPAQEMACYGCKPENECAYSELRACASERAVYNCGLCDAYPCRLINTALERSDKLSFRATSVCTPMEMETLKEAFFSKRKNLDQIHLKKQRER